MQVSPQSTCDHKQNQECGHGNEKQAKTKHEQCIHVQAFYTRLCKAVSPASKYLDTASAVLNCPSQQIIVFSYTVSF